MTLTCDELIKRIQSGEVHSLLAVVQIGGSPLPLMAMVGGYKEDPFRALVALERALVQVHRKLDEIPATGDFNESMSRA